MPVLHETERVNVTGAQTTGCLIRNKAGMEIREYVRNPLLLNFLFNGLQSVSF
jgi:hypothetical protein